MNQRVLKPVQRETNYSYGNQDPNPDKGPALLGQKRLLKAFCLAGLSTSVFRPNVLCVLHLDTSGIKKWVVLRRTNATVPT